MKEREEISRYRQAAMFLPVRLRKLAQTLPKEDQAVAEEFRLRTGWPMLVLICAAAVLNWQATQKAAPEGGGASSDTAQAGGKLLGEAALVSGGDGAVSAAGSTASVDETGVYTGGDYFASARLTRQQARDSAVALLQQAAEEDGAAQSALDKASEGIQAMWYPARVRNRL